MSDINSTEPTIYGLAHCGTCKKAMAWLDQRGISYRFVDYRDQPLTADLLRQCAAQLGWEKLVNRASYSWRDLPAERKTPVDESAWLALVAEIPTLIKRPLLLREGRANVGFSDKSYSALFGA
jgi:Spx/MgsR family transcriptional regulator